jgi:5-methylcytosine-specific restriction protein A
MPTINREYIKPPKEKYQREENSSPYYNSNSWRLLRKFYYERHPLCQECLKRDIVRPAEEIHHKRPFLTGETEEERWRLFLDENNLMSLCSVCHDKLHLKAKRYGLLYIDELTDKEYYEDIYQYRI